MIKRKFIVSTMLTVALATPTLAYAQVNNFTEGDKAGKPSIEEKYSTSSNNLEEKEGKCKGKCEGKFRNRAARFNKLLSSAEGITNENKTAIETALQKQQDLHKEIFKITGMNNKEQLDAAVKEKIKAIKDKVKSGAITKEEARNQIRDLMRENSEYWKKLSQEGKNEIKAVEGEIDKSRETRKQIADDFQKAIDGKNVDAINSNAKKLADSLNSQNKLLQKKIDILNKYIK